MNERNVTPIPREVLVRQGLSALACFAGGAFLLVMTVGARFRILGIVLSALALVLGIGALLSRDRGEKRPGIILVAAGILGMAFRFRIPVLQSIAGTLLGIGALGLFVAGILKGIVFLMGLKSRQ